MMVLEPFWMAGRHPQQKYQSLPPEICVENLQKTPKNMLYNDYIQRTSRSVIWRKLNYHLISHSFILLALGPKHNTFFSFDRRLMEQWKQPDRQLKVRFPPLSLT
jgi:hypothetical protein